MYNHITFRMRVIHRFLALFTLALTSATILQNGQVRENPYPGQVSAIDLDDSWNTYPPDSPEISYKGRWDSKHVSCMSTPHPFPGFFLFDFMLTDVRVVVCLTLFPVHCIS